MALQQRPSWHDDAALGAVQPIIAADQEAISRLSEIRTALSEATATLDSAFRALAALDEKLGYIPGVSAAKPNGSVIGSSAEENGELP